MSCLGVCQINKCLKSLEQRKLVKAVKSVANGNRKVYMLFELEPSREITGGAWYTGHEYDSEFIAVLRQECHKYIKREKRATLGAPAAVLPAYASLCALALTLLCCRTHIARHDVRLCAQHQALQG